MKGGVSLPNVVWRNGKPYVRLVLHDGPRGRVRILLAHCRSESEIRERRDLVLTLADRLRSAGRIEVAVELLKRAGSREGKALDAVCKAIDAVCNGATVKKPLADDTTFRAFAESWTNGDLHRQFPDHVKQKKTADDDKGRLERHVYPVVGDLPLPMVGLDVALRVLQLVPAGRSRATRRHVAQLIHRVLQLAVYPARMIASNPLPRGFLPSAESGKAKGLLYPDEERQLLGCRRVPLVWRMFWGVLAREGMRRDEAVRLDWCDLDLQRGALRLEQNKTDDPRSWALSPDVLAALSKWKVMRGKVEPTDPVFVGEGGGRLNAEHAADLLRSHLRMAGVTRDELMRATKQRLRLRAHDLRATFITVALAAGRSEAWISDRTGHKSSQMIHKYYRQSRTFDELGIGPLSPMDRSIPEFVAQTWPTAGPRQSGVHASIHENPKLLN